jgi:2-dehydro-3-deoxyphosphogluconate aldolase/(4S)-4-hydroxy-2-oxoglutarate aldolase
MSRTSPLPRVDLDRDTPDTDALSRIEHLGVIPVVEVDSVNDAALLLDALIAGGLPAAEITLRTEAGVATIAALRNAHPDALIGAGTVRSAAEARRVIDAGAQFVVAPGTNPEVIAVCRAAGVPVVPGACTPTEIEAALRAGADAVKFFPAEAMGGTTFLKALAGPYRDVRFVPSGGITAANIADYLGIEQVLACGGSWMVTQQLIADGDFDRVQTLAREALAIVAGVRAGG